MIANHDFERKVNDIKRYLEKGDKVKVSWYLHQHPSRQSLGMVFKNVYSKRNRLRLAACGELYLGDRFVLGVRPRLWQQGERVKRTSVRFVWNADRRVDSAHRQGKISPHPTAT